MAAERPLRFPGGTRARLRLPKGEVKKVDKTYGRGAPGGRRKGGSQGMSRVLVRFRTASRGSVRI